MLSEIFSELARPEVLLLIFAGSVVGYIFGVLPGLSGITALALLAPLGLFIDPKISFYLFASLLGSSVFAGAVPAILLRIPGTAYSIVTMFDGFPMAQKGRALEALTISAVASAVGGLLSIVFFALLLPVAREGVLLFGSAETFWLVTWAVLTVPALSGKTISKGLAAAFFGAGLALVGRSLVTGEFRFTAGTYYLGGGLATIPFLAIGVFAISTLLPMLQASSRTVSTYEGRLDWRQIGRGFRTTLARPVSLIRNSAIGTLIGAIPGLGGVTASFAAYATERGVAKDRSEFGKGDPRGVLAPEAANNAVAGGALLPTLLLGIPGSLEWAIIIGIFQMNGIQPGPQLFADHIGTVWGIVFGLAFSTVIASTIGLLACVPLSRLAKVPFVYVAALVIPFCYVGAFLVNQNPLDAGLAFFGGVVGYLLARYGYDLLPFALGYILVPIMETTFYQTIQIGFGSAGAFASSTLSIGLIVFCVVTLAATPWLRARLSP